MSKTRGTKNKSVYIDPDSDVDMTEAEHEVQLNKALHSSGLRPNNNSNNFVRARKKVGDTYGTGDTSNKRKQARYSWMMKKKSSDLPSLSMFASMPFDIFIEICSHLYPQDLLALSRTSRAFRAALLSSQASTAWQLSRKSWWVNDYPPPPEGLSEYRYTSILDESGCMMCSERAGSYKFNWMLMIRLCDKCEKQDCVFSGRPVAGLRHLHPDTTKCVRYAIPTLYVEEEDRLAPLRQVDWEGKVIYLRSDLEAVSHRLFELQDEDELAEFSRVGPTFGGTRSRPGQQRENVGLSAVESFVEGRQKKVKAAIEVSKTRAIELYDHKKAEKARQELKNLEASKLRESRVEQFRQAGWTNDETRIVRWRGMYSKQLDFPKGEYDDDPLAWEAIHPAVTAFVAKEDAAYDRRRVANNDPQNRMQQLRPYYHRIRANQDDALKTVTFPRFDAFLKLDSVRSMWYPLDAVVDKPNWTQKLASVDEDAQSYRKTRRTEAIRVILAATNGVELDTLPTHSRAYEDENKFGEAFFKRITSLFMHENIDLDDDDAPITYDIVPFPDCLALSTSTDPDVDYKLAKVKTARQVVVIRILLGLAGLEEDSATREQLDEVGRRFRWIDHPVKIYRKAKGTWLEVLFEVLTRKPKNSNPPPDIILCDNEGASDSSDEDSPDSDSASDSDSDGAMTITRRRRVVSDSEEEEESSEEESEEGEVQIKEEEEEDQLQSDDEE